MSRVKCHISHVSVVDCSSERQHVSQVTSWQPGLHSFLLTQRPCTTFWLPSPWTSDPGPLTLDSLDPRQPCFTLNSPDPGQRAYTLDPESLTACLHPGQLGFTLDSLASPWTARLYPGQPGFTLDSLDTGQPGFNLNPGQPGHSGLYISSSLHVGWSTLI